MISRIVDHCFWFGRYLDRAESTARLLQATRSLASDAELAVTRCWQPLVIVAGEEEPFVKLYGRDAFGDGELVQEQLTWSRESLVSLSSSVRFARECARSIRDQLSLDAWEEINELYLWLDRKSTRDLYMENREEFYRTVRRATQLTMGLVRSTMLHEAPMNFLWMGVMLERAGQTARILDMHHHTMEHESVTNDIVQVALWMSLLRACSGSEAFMKKHQGRVTAHSMVAFLLFEPAFPRSLRYCLQTGAQILRRVWPDLGVGGALPPSRARIETLLAWLTEQEQGFEVGRIHKLLTHVVDETAAICSLIGTEIQGPPRVAVHLAGEQAG